jgi:hypothetical protein
MIDVTQKIIDLAIKRDIEGMKNTLEMAGWDQISVEGFLIGFTRGQWRASYPLEVYFQGASNV